MKRRTPQEELDDRVISAIHPYVTSLLTHYADSDSAIQNVEALLDMLTFNSPWHIEWGLEERDEDEEDAEELTQYRKNLLNTEDFKTKLQVVLSRARRLSRRFRVVAMYVYDEARMADWLHAYLQANSAERADMPPPFGVIEPSESIIYQTAYVSGEMLNLGLRVPSRRLEVEWTPPLPAKKKNQGQENAGEIAPKNVKTWVHSDVALNLSHMDSDLSAGFIQEAMKLQNPAPVFEHARSRLSLTDMKGSNVPMVSPNSPLFDLLALKKKLVEAIENRANAEGVLVQPSIAISFETPKLNTEDVQRLSQRDLALNDDVTGALIQDLDRIQTYTHEQWKATEDELDRVIHPPELFGPNQLSVSEQARLRFHRPSPHERIFKPPHGVKIADVHKPQTLCDVEVLDDRYKQAVAEALGIGTSILQQYGGGGKSSASGSSPFGALTDAQIHETPAERYLQDKIQGERKWMSMLFEQIYVRLMNALDMQYLNDIEAFCHHVGKVNLKEAKLAVQAMEQELAREMSFGDTETESTAADDNLIEQRAKAKKGYKKSKMTLRHWRALVDKLRTQPNAMARLVFQTNATGRARQNLQVMVEAFYDRGLVTPETMEPDFKQVFGPKRSLVRNPEPPLQPATALSPGDELKAKTQLQTQKLQANTAVETTKMKANHKDDSKRPKKKARK